MSLGSRREKPNKEKIQKPRFHKSHNIWFGCYFLLSILIPFDRHRGWIRGIEVESTTNGKQDNASHRPINVSSLVLQFAQRIHNGRTIFLNIKQKQWRLSASVKKRDEKEIPNCELRDFIACNCLALVGLKRPSLVQRLLWKCFMAPLFCYSTQHHQYVTI